MNARIVAFMASRLFAVYVLVAYVLNFALQLGSALLMTQTEYGARALAYAGSLVFATAFYAVIVAVLWFGAGWIAGRIAGPASSEDLGKMDIDAWKALVLMAIGAFFVLTAARFAGQGLDILFLRAPSSGSAPDASVLMDKMPGGEAETLRNRLWYVLASTAFYGVIGIVLITFSLSMVRGMKALRAWFDKPAFGEDEQ